MPYGGNDWLALTQEAALEPDLPICDPHHHFWDFRTGRIPYQRYLLPELIADVDQGHNVRSTVCIEARAMYRADGPAEMRSVGEIEFVQGLAAASASGLYGPSRAAATIVGHADLKLGDRVEPVLEALQAASPNRFKGIRHIVTWDRDPHVESREVEGVLSTPQFRAGAKALGRMGLTLDTISCWPQLPEMVAFARAAPEVTIVMNHLGGLNRTGRFAGKDDEVMPAWRAGMAELAKCPNVLLKLGGHGAAVSWLRLASRATSRSAPRSSAPRSALLMDYCIEQFGPDQAACSKATPWPDKVSFSHPDPVQCVQAPVEGLFGVGARRVVPRHRGTRLSHRCSLIEGDSRRDDLVRVRRSAVRALARLRPAAAPVFDFHGHQPRDGHRQIELPGNRLEIGQAAGKRVDWHDVAVAHRRQRRDAEIEHRSEFVRYVRSGRKMGESAGDQLPDEPVGRGKDHRCAQINNDRALQAMEGDPAGRVDRVSHAKSGPRTKG